VVRVLTLKTTSIIPLLLQVRRDAFVSTVHSRRSFTSKASAGFHDVIPREDRFRMRLYGDIAPSLMTDEQIDYTIKELDEDLAACAKLKGEWWNARLSDRQPHWHDDPSTIPVQVYVTENGVEYNIAGGTIYNTQRELFFMAAMREEYPKIAREYRATLVYIRELRKKAARRKARPR
jgi:hypothetical protein